MRRLTIALVAFAVSAAPAGARDITGTDRADRIAGTADADSIEGRGGNDRLEGRGGNDFLEGGRGRDVLGGGPGGDRIAVHADGRRDVVTCGPGRDVVNAERGDRVGGDCEVVSRQLSRDPYRNRESQHETAVEPDSFSFGSTIVATYQVGRYYDGGASGVGFSTSVDGGRTWRTGVLPRLTIFSTPAGTAARVSDPVVAYDAAHDVWLIATLGVSPALTQLFISRSRDGVRWGAPVVASRAATQTLAYDKEWLTCDNWPGSPFYGRCYLSYTDIRGRQLATQRSSDGGATWSRAVGRTSGPGGTRQSVSGAQPVVRPDGALVVLFTASRDRLAATQSTDGGLSFTPPVTVTALETHRPTAMRAFPLPSVDVDAAGRLYAVWHGCQLRPRCSGNDILLRVSGDGVAWSPPRRVAGGPRSRGDFIIPAIAVQPVGISLIAALSVVYYVLPTASCAEAACRVDVAATRSVDEGRTWTPPQRLNARSMRIPWIARTTSGRMLADYISTSFVDDRAIPVFSLASPRDGTTFRQAIFATTVAR